MNPEERPLFVYGSLRRRPDGSLRPLLGPRARWLGYGSIAATLLDLGPYPGVVAPRHPGARTHGDLIAVDPAAWPELDTFEGMGPGFAPPTEYVRRPTPVECPGGATIEAWVYWYQWSPAGVPEVPDGRYRPD